jgi:hypothetical protein
MEDVGELYGHLVYFVVVLVHFSRFGMLYQEISGNPVANAKEQIGDIKTWNLTVKPRKNIRMLDQQCMCC